MALAAVVALWLVSFPSYAQEAAAPPPKPKTESTVTYDCRKISDDAIHIDGVLDESIWNAAAPMTNFQTAGPKPVTAKYASRVRLLWSEKRLFLAFECSTDTIFGIGKERDDDIWFGETAELYLCPRGSEAKYYEIDFNPQNVIYDSLVHTYKYAEQAKHYKEWAKAYNPKIESFTKIGKDKDGKVTGWILEAAIPLEELREADHVPPRVGDTWLFNVCRIAQVNEKECDFSAWVPTMADFHKPWKFPTLRFADVERPATP